MKATALDNSAKSVEYINLYKLCMWLHRHIRFVLVALATPEAQPQRSFLWWPQCVDRFYNAGASWMGVNFWYRREMATFQWLVDLGSQINFVYLVEFMSSLGLYGQETLRLMAS